MNTVDKFKVINDDGQTVEVTGKILAREKKPQSQASQPSQAQPESQQAEPSEPA